MHRRSLVIAFKCKSHVVLPCGVVVAVPILLNEFFWYKLDKYAMNVAIPIAKLATFARIYFCRGRAPLLSSWTIGSGFLDRAYWCLDGIDLFELLHISPDLLLDGFEQFRKLGSPHGFDNKMTFISIIFKL